MSQQSEIEAKRAHAVKSLTVIERKEKREHKKQSSGVSKLKSGPIRNIF